MNGFTARDVPSQQGKTFLVTGANAGIGFEVAKALAEKGARVMLGCRSEHAAGAAMDQIKHQVPGAQLSFLPLDLADLDSVRAAASLVSKGPRLDVLINNAGVMTPPLMHTKQGFELQFGVNHLGTFLLTTLLLPKLQQAPNARVVITSSIIHSRGKAVWSDPRAASGYDKMQRYADSKLANLLFLLELNRRLQAEGSTTIAVGCHPGMAQTSLGRYAGALQVLNPLVGLMLNTAERGAWPALQAATADVKPGDYFGPIGFKGVRGVSGPAKRADNALNATDAQELWRISEQLISG